MKFGFIAEIDLYLKPDKKVPSAFSTIPLMMFTLSLTFYWTPSVFEIPWNSEGLDTLKFLYGNLSGTCPSYDFPCFFLIYVYENFGLLLSKNPPLLSPSVLGIVTKHSQGYTCLPYLDGR